MLFLLSGYIYSFLNHFLSPFSLNSCLTAPLKVLVAAHFPIQCKLFCPHITPLPSSNSLLLPSRSYPFLVFLPTPLAARSRSPLPVRIPRVTVHTQPEFQALAASLSAPARSYFLYSHGFTHHVCASDTQLIFFGPHLSTELHPHATACLKSPLARLIGLSK